MPDEIEQARCHDMSTGFEVASDIRGAL